MRYFMTDDRVNEVLEDKTDADSVAIVLEQLKSQGEAIEQLRSEIQQALSTGVTEAIEKLVEDGDRSEDEEYDPIRTTIGEPDDRQLAQIIKLTGVTSTADQWLVAGVHASNQLLDRSGRRWSTKVIAMMGADFVGRSLIIDHLWSSAEASRGLIVSSALVTDQASIVPKDMLTGAGAEEYNKEIIEKEGLVWLYMCVAVPRTSPTADMISNRLMQDVSTGSLLHFPYLRCPNCERKSGGKEVRMDTYSVDKHGNKVFDCEHLAGSPFLQSVLGDEYQNYAFSDYVILDAESVSSIELSLCQAGCLPKASIIRR